MNSEGGRCVIIFFMIHKADVIFHASVNLNESQISEATLSMAYLF